MTTPVSEEMLTYAEVAARLKRSVTWLEKKVRAGRIPFHRQGRNVRFNWSEILAWVKEEGIEYDNRIQPVRPLKKHGGEKTVYANHTLGDLEHCWCGEPIDHGWEGKESGAPHPHEHERMQQVVVVQEGFVNEPPHIDTKALRGYHSDLREFLRKCINVDGMRYRITRNEVILYPPDESRPISVYARNSNQQIRSLRQWYDAHASKTEVTVEPDLAEAIRDLAEHVNDPVSHPVPEPVEPASELEWRPYVGTDGEPNEYYETNGTTVRCIVCVGTPTAYETPVDQVTGLGGHIRMNHRDKSNLFTPEAKEKSVYVRKFNRLEAKVRKAMALLADYEPVDESEVEELRDKVGTLVNDNAELRRENDTLKARIALIEEAFRGTQ